MGCYFGTFLARACLLSCHVGTEILVSLTPWVKDD